jgi:cobalt-zinc-cadmium efflux system outer membrane protein
MTLADALAALRGGNPRTAADRARVDVARADVVAAGVLPNPVLDYEGTRLESGVNTGAATVDSWSVEWPVLVSGQRAARTQAAKSAASATEAHVEAGQAERALALRHAFGSLLIQQERVVTLRDARRDLERAAGIVSGRHDAGDASSYDALRVDIELRAKDAELGDAEGDLADVQGRVARLLGRPGLIPHAIGAIPDGTNLPTSAEISWKDVAERLPALEAARRDEEAARAGERAARRDRWPVPSFTGGVVNTHDAASRSIQFGVSIPLPALDRNQGALARARATEHAAALDRQALEAEARSDLASALAVDAKRRAAVAEIESGVFAKLPELRAMAEAAYREGRGGILEWLDALRTLTSARLSRLDALESASLADADLLYLTGRIEDTPQ